ncbi:MAG: helix-turn-helix domain-containing protein [Clostridia bacterium]|nr:helix-turn-helix domain-containing protein [Clostridia bacterium]
MQISAYQSYFETIKHEFSVRAGLLDENEVVVASTVKEWEGLSLNKIDISDYKLYGVSEKMPGMMLFIETDKMSEKEYSVYASVMCASLLAVHRINLQNNDSEYFLKQIINGKAGDMATRARLLKIQSDAIRVVMVIRTEPKHVEEVIQIVKNLAVGRLDFIFENQSGELLFIRTCKSEPSAHKLHSIAKTLSDAIAAEAMEFVSIGIGTVIYDLEELEHSYKSAVNALEIGEIFVNKHRIYAYSNLGISRLISSVPIGKCKAFLNEVLSERILSEIDEETLDSIQKFLDCDMNIASAAKALYIHRNTMVYRLDRLQKQTGLDVRRFEDAMLFKMAMLIHKYLRATRR